MKRAPLYRQCAACAKPCALRADGLIRAHKDLRNGITRRDSRGSWCEGSHRPPMTAGDETTPDA